MFNLLVVAADKQHFVVSSGQLFENSCKVLSQQNPKRKTETYSNYCDSFVPARYAIVQPGSYH